jgi:hypothetical protein
MHDFVVMNPMKNSRFPLQGDLEFPIIIIGRRVVQEKHTGGGS